MSGPGDELKKHWVTTILTDTVGEWSGIPPEHWREMEHDTDDTTSIEHGIMAAGSETTCLANEESVEEVRKAVTAKLVTSISLPLESEVTIYTPDESDGNEGTSAVSRTVDCAGTICLATANVSCKPESVGATELCLLGTKGIHTKAANDAAPDESVESKRKNVKQRTELSG